MKKVCFFGIYNPEYARNKILMAGFKKNGYEVVECRVNPQKEKRFAKYWKLFAEYQKIKANSFDYIIVAFPGHTVVWLARILFGNRIIFDASLSLQNANVFDRKLYSSGSFRGRKDFFLDALGVRLSSKVLLDTVAHIRYFTETFGAPMEKFIRVPVGADDTLFFPAEKKDVPETFVVHFHGTFIPVQGIEYVVKAAKLLEKDTSIIFNIIGNGQEYFRIKALTEDLGVRNVNFPGRIPYEEVRGRVCGADVCLGLFGDSARIELSVPNKVFEAIACGKAVITARTEAVSEFFADGENIMLCERGDENGLAKKIQYLKENPDIKKKIGQNAYKIFTEKFTPQIIIGDLLESLK